MQILIGQNISHTDLDANFDRKIINYTDLDANLSNSDANFDHFDMNHGNSDANLSNSDANFDSPIILLDANLGKPDTNFDRLEANFNNSPHCKMQILIGWWEIVQIQMLILIAPPTLQDANFDRLAENRGAFDANFDRLNSIY